MQWFNRVAIMFAPLKLKSVWAGLLLVAECVSDHAAGHVASEFTQFKNRMFFYEDQKMIPPDKLERVLVDWKKDFDRTGERPACPYPTDAPYLFSGKDPWGSPFVYQVDRETKVVTIRSIGKNRIHENGKGDDIERQISLGE